MKNFGCFLAFLFTFSALPAYASDFTIFGGVQKPGKLTLRDAAQTSRTLTDPRDFGTFGIRYTGARVAGVETTIAYSPNFLESETKAIMYHGNLIIQAPLPKVRPYVTAGLGQIFTSGEGLGDFGSKFSINYGAGIKTLLAGPVGLSFDVRGYTIPSVQDQTLNLFQVSLGIVFSSGR